MFVQEMHASPALFKAKPVLQAQLLGSSAGTKLFASSHLQPLLPSPIKCDYPLHTQLVLSLFNTKLLLASHPQVPSEFAVK